jgi:hypothetical protein
MKTKLVISTMLGLAFAATAQGDQCAAIERQVAEKALEHVKQGQTLVHLCEPCEGDEARATKVEKVAVADWGEEGLAEIQVNGEGIDAAYVFVEGDEPDQWRNLADLIGCPADGVSKELEWSPPKEG